MKYIQHELAFKYITGPFPKMRRKALDHVREVFGQAPDSFYDVSIIVLRACKKNVRNFPRRRTY